MKHVLVFQHVPHEILGTFHPLLKAAGLRIRYANFSREPEGDVDISEYDGLVVLGGPMGVYEADRFPHLKYEMQQIEKAMKQEKPVLGICLGAQLIAATLGADVAPGPTKEIGWFDISLTDQGQGDKVLGHLNKTEKIFQWHGDNFDLPSGATCLATSPVCPYQAFRYGDRTYGFQFHLEVDEPMVHRWLKVETMRAELEAFAGPQAVEQLSAATHQHIGRLKSLSEKVFSTYLDLFVRKSSTTILGSGHR